ncbi:hypothetical protein, partial [Ruminococcus bromii]|uniref:hypothetical protein n=1 Tax=Ruminococcus bromii TaxID=40518 RepID=UPI003A930390
FVIKSIFYSSLDFGISKYNYGSEKTPAGSLVIGILDVIIALMWFFQLQTVDTNVHFRCNP